MFCNRGDDTCKPDRLKRVYEPRMDFLQPGDILVYADFENGNGSKSAGNITKWDAYLLTDEFIPFNSDWEKDDWVEDEFFEIEGHSANPRFSYGDGYGKAVHFSSDSKTTNEDRMLFYKVFKEGESRVYLGYTNHSKDILHLAGPLWEVFNRDIFFVIRPSQMGNHEKHNFVNGVCTQCLLHEDSACVVSASLSTVPGTASYNIQKSKNASIYLKVQNFASESKKIKITVPATKFTAQTSIEKNLAADSSEWVEFKLALDKDIARGDVIEFNSVDYEVNGMKASFDCALKLNIVSGKGVNEAGGFDVVDKIYNQPSDSMKKMYDAIGLSVVYSDYDKAVRAMGLSSSTVSSLNDGIMRAQNSNTKEALFLRSMVVKNYLRLSTSKSFPELKASDLKAGDCYYLMTRVSDNKGFGYIGAFVRSEDVILHSISLTYNEKTVVSQYRVCSIEDFAEFINELNANANNSKVTNLTDIYCEVLLRPSQAYENINQNKSAFSGK